MRAARGYLHPQLHHSDWFRNGPRQVRARHHPHHRDWFRTNWCKWTFVLQMEERKAMHEEAYGPRNQPMWDTWLPAWGRGSCPTSELYSNERQQILLLFKPFESSVAYNKSPNWNRETVTSSKVWHVVDVNKPVLAVVFLYSYWGSYTKLPGNWGDGGPALPAWHRLTWDSQYLWPALNLSPT